MRFAAKQDHLVIDVTFDGIPHIRAQTVVKRFISGVGGLYGYVVGQAAPAIAQPPLMACPMRDTSATSPIMDRTIHPMKKAWNRRVTRENAAAAGQ